MTWRKYLSWIVSVGTLAQNRSRPLGLFCSDAFSKDSFGC